MANLMIIVLIAIFSVVLAQNVTRPNSASSDRDSFRNRNCDWQACLKYASTCHTAACCSCMCNTGTTYMSLNKSCVAEKQIATGCNFMAQTSATAPWSFKQISVATINELASGLRIFHCTLSSCVTATDCNIMNLQYDNHGWKNLPTSNFGRLSISQNLLKLTGSKCYHEIFRGLLLSASLKCNVKGSTTSSQSSCIILKVSGNYEVGTSPDAKNTCKENTNSTTFSIQPSRSSTSASLPTSSHGDNMATTTKLASTMASALQIGSARATKSSKLARKDAIAPTSIISSPSASTSSKNLPISSPVSSNSDTSRTNLHSSNQSTILQTFPSSDVKVTSSDLVKMTSNRAMGTEIGASTTLQPTISPGMSKMPGEAVTTKVMGTTSQIPVNSISASKSIDKLPPKTSIIITLPNSATNNNNEFDFVMFSSLAGGIALFILLALGLFLLLIIIKRKRARIRRKSRKVIVRKFSDGLATFKKNPLRSAPPLRHPPTPSIIQLGSIHRQEKFDIHMGTSDRLNLACSWNSKQEEDFDDDDYDIPADPPQIERSFSALYAKVDKSGRKFAVEPDEGYTSVNGDISPKTEASRISFDHVYDEPGSMLGPGADDDVMEGESNEDGQEEREKENFEKYLRSVLE